MSFFNDTFLDSIHKNEFFDSIIKIYLLGENNNKKIREKEFIAHRLILSYHSTYFMDEFLNLKERTKNNNEDNNIIKKTSKKNTIKEIKSNNILHISFEYSQKKLFKRFNILFDYLYGKPYHPNDVCFFLNAYIHFCLLFIKENIFPCSFIIKNVWCIIII